MSDISISDQAKIIIQRFDENVFAFLKILAPVIPLIILYNSANFIVRDSSLLSDLLFKFMQYYGCSALIYHWMVYLLNGRAPLSWLHTLKPDKEFIKFLSVVIGFRLMMEADMALFFLMQNNDFFIENFRFFRYGLMILNISAAYLIFRLSFTLPAIADRENISKKTLWHATQRDPYFIILSGFHAALPYILAVILIPPVMDTIIRMIFEVGQEKIAAFFSMALYMPVAALLIPIVLAIGAGTLCHHYKQRVESA